MNELIFLEPIFKEKIWGGDALKKRFNYNTPNDHIGECWAVSGNRGGESLIREGAFKGYTLNALWKTHKELFGGQSNQSVESKLSGDQFPILIKLIDARDDLSIQVHPGDDYAKKHERGSLGKTECWFILDCDEKSGIIIGHNASSKEELKQMISEGRWDELLKLSPIHRGDFFFIEPGTIHAIKAGTLLIEIQENSDITYRLYDYGRLENGKPRPLNIEKALDVITCPSPFKGQNRKVETGRDYRSEKLIECPYFKLEHLELNGIKEHKSPEFYEIIAVLNGEGIVGDSHVKKGDFFLIPHCFGDYKTVGKMELMLVNP